MDKLCTKCGSNDIPINKYGKKGSRCYKCLAEYKMKNYYKNHEHYLRYNKKYWRKNKEKILKRNKKYKKDPNKKKQYNKKYDYSEHGKEKRRQNRLKQIETLSDGYIKRLIYRELYPEIKRKAKNITKKEIDKKRLQIKLRRLKKRLKDKYPKEYLKIKSRTRFKQYTKELHDLYVIQCILASPTIDIERSKITPEMIEVKREQLTLTRLRKELRNGITRRSNRGN